VADFNNMVREVKSVTGDIGIDVLPVVPVCYEGVDKLGQELLGGLRMWVNWISLKSGRIEIMELASTVRQERAGGEMMTFLWKPPSCCCSPAGGRLEIGGKGNTLTLLGGEREEWKVRGALPAREIKRLMGWKGEFDQEGEMETERDDKQKARETFERGISV
jgi:hypothetical protein